MRTTKKIVSAVLAACILPQQRLYQALPQQPMTVRQFQATTQETILTQRLLKILTLSMLTPAMILVLLTQKDATTFKVWSPTATGVKLNIFTKGSDDEQGASKVASYTLEKNAR